MNIKRNVIAVSLLLGALGGASGAQAATHHHLDSLRHRARRSGVSLSMGSLGGARPS